MLHANGETALTSVTQIRAVLSLNLFDRVVCVTSSGLIKIDSSAS